MWIPFNPVTNETRDISVTSDNGGNAVLKSNGGMLYSYAVILKDLEVWAEVLPATGREYEEAQKIRAETTYKITTRHFQGITADMKILYGVKIFDIISVLNVGERNVELQIVVKEKDRNGKE